MPFCSRATRSRVCRRRGCGEDEVFKLLALARVVERGQPCMTPPHDEDRCRFKIPNRPVLLARCTFRWQLKQSGHGSLSRSRVSCSYVL